MAQARRLARHAAPAGDAGAVGNHRRVDARPVRRLAAIWRGGVPRSAGGQRLRQLPQPAASGVDPPDDGPVPDVPRQRQVQPRHRGAARRELRPRTDAVVQHRPAATQARRHGRQRGRQAAGDLWPGRHHRAGADLHRLGLRHLGHRQHHARLPPPDYGANRQQARDRRLDLPRPDGAGRPERRGGADCGAGHHLCPPQCRAVHQPTVDPAPGHQQPQPGLCAACGDGVRQRQQWRQRQLAGCVQGDPARRRGAQRQQCGTARIRQAARAVAALRRLGTRLQRDFAQRCLGDRRPVRPRHPARPEQPALTFGLQLLSPRLCTAEQRDRVRRAGGAGVPDHQRVVGGRLHQHDAGRRQQRHWRRQGRLQQPAAAGR